MSVYLIGVVVALLLVLIVHWIEWYEGVDKQLGETVFVSIMLPWMSWVMVLMMGGCIVYHVFGMLQAVQIKGRKNNENS